MSNLWQVSWSNLPPVWGDASARGGEFFEYKGFQWFWARCHATDCPNNVCHKLSEKFCWPHLEHREEIEAEVLTEPATAPAL